MVYEIIPHITWVGFQPQPIPKNHQVVAHLFHGSGWRCGPEKPWKTDMSWERDVAGIILTPKQAYKNLWNISNTDYLVGGWTNPFEKY